MKTTSNLRVGIALLIGTLLGLPLHAEEPVSSDGFHYRGELRDGGRLASGRYDVRASLYTGPRGEGPLDVLEFPSLAVRDGRLDLPLHFAHDAAAAGQWLELAVRESGSKAAFEVLGDRRPLQAAEARSVDLPGVTAIGQAWDASVPSNILIDGGSYVTLASVNVPAGTYVAIARLQVRTGNEANPSSSYRLDCSLSPNMDLPIYRVGTESSVERYITFQGAAVLSAPGQIELKCRDGNNHTDTILGGKLTVLAVGAVN